MTQHLSSAEKKDLSHRTLYSVKIFFRNNWKIKIFSHEKPLRKSVARRPNQRMVQGSYLNRKKMIKEDTWEYHQRGKNKQKCD